MGLMKRHKNQYDSVSFEPTGKNQPSMTTRVDPNSPIHWPGAITLFGTTIAALILVPAYAWFNDYSTAAWVLSLIHI